MRQETLLPNKQLKQHIQVHILLIPPATTEDEHMNAEVKLK